MSNDAQGLRSEEKEPVDNRFSVGSYYVVSEDFSSPFGEFKKGQLFRAGYVGAPYLQLCDVKGVDIRITAVEVPVFKDGAASSISKRIGNGLDMFKEMVYTGLFIRIL